MNQFFISGNLCADPEVIEFKNGGRIVKARMAHNEKDYPDRNGQMQKGRVTYLRIQATNGTSQILETLRKGDKVMVSGKMNYDTWTDKTTGKETGTVTFIALEIHQGTRRPTQEVEEHDEEVVVSKPAGKRSKVVAAEVEDAPF